MGKSKTALFSEKENHLALLARALAHPARIKIMEHLLSARTCICNELVRELPLSQPTISQHLKELKTAGLIKGTIAGASVNYCIDASRWSEVANLFQDFFNKKPLDLPCEC